MMKKKSHSELFDEQVNRFLIYSKVLIPIRDHSLHTLLETGNVNGISSAEALQVAREMIAAKLVASSEKEIIYENVVTGRTYLEINADSSAAIIMCIGGDPSKARRVTMEMFAMANTLSAINRR